MRVLQSAGSFHGAWSVMTTIATAGVLGLGIVALRPFVGSAQERVAEPSVPFAPPGTAFSFEVIEPETPQPAEKKRQGPPPDY